MSKPRYRLPLYKLVERKGPTCYYCGVTTFIQKQEDHCRLDGLAATRDHIVPLAKAGKNVYANIAVACYACNLKKADSDREDFLKSNWLKGRLRSVGYLNARVNRQCRRMMKRSDLIAAFNSNVIYFREYIN